MSEKPTYEVLAQKVAVLETRLQQLEHLDLFFQYSTDGIFLMMLDEPVHWNNTIDKETTLDYIFAHQRITRFNQGILKQNEMSAEACEGMTLDDIYKANLSKGRKLWAAFLDEGRWESEQNLLLTFAKKTLVIKGVYEAIYDDQGRFCGLFGVHKDITEQKRNEQQLKEIQHFNEVVFNSLDANICVLDKEGEIVQTNQAWKDFARENGGDFSRVAENVNYLNVCRVEGSSDLKSRNDQQEAAKAQQGIRAVLLGKQTHFQLQYPCHGKDEERWFLMNVRALNGNIKGAVVSHVNVTSLKKAYDKIQDSEHKMQLITNALQLSIYQFISYKEDFIRFEFVSGGVKGVLRQNVNKTIDLQDLMGSISQNYRHEFNASIKEALKNKTPWVMEFPVMVSPNEEKWLLAQAFPEEAGADKVYWNGLLMDISSHKALDRHLQLQEAIIRNLNDAILVTEAEPIDKPGPRILYVNAAFEKMTEYAIGEIKGETPRVLQGAKTDRTVLDKMRSSFENWEPIEVELINYTKSGEEFWVNISIVPIANETGWYTHWVSIQKDITERKKQEEKIRASEIKYRTFFEESPVGVAIIDPDTKKAVEYNEQAATILGYNKEEFKDLSLLDYLKKNEAEIEEVINKLDMQMVFTSEQDMVKKNGEDGCMLVTLKKIEMEGRELVFSLRLDLTRQKHLENQFNAFFETSLDLLSMISFDGYFTKLNKAWEHTLGYTLEEMKSQPFVEFIHEDDRAVSVSEAAKLTNGGSSIGFINRYKRKNGQYIWLEWNAIAIPSEKLLYASARDITSELKAKENLAIKEAKYRALFEYSPEGILLFDESDWKPTEFNDKVVEILGYSREEFRQMPLQQYLVDYPDRAQIDEVAKLVKKNESLEKEIRMVHKNGEIRIILAKIKYIELAEHGVFFDIWADITEKKRAEENIRVSEERFRSAIDSNLDAFYILDAYYDEQGEVTDFTFVDMNKVGCDVINLPREEIFGEKLCDILPLNREQGFFEKYKQVFLTGKTLDEEVYLEDAKLKLSWIHHTVIKLKSGIAITTRDIHQRKRNEEQISIANEQLRTQQRQMEDLLQEITVSEQKFRSLAENIKDVFWVFKNGSIEYVSPAYEDIWQKSIQSLHNHSDLLLDRVHPDDKARVQEVFYGEHFRKTGNFSEEYRLLRDDKTVHWVDVRTFPVVVNNTTFHIVGIAKDITKRKETEKQLRQLNLKLAAQNNELITREEELKLTNEELNANKETLEEALDQLVRSESNLKALFDSSDQAIVLLDTQFRIISFNKAVNLFHPQLEQNPLKVGNSIFGHYFDTLDMKQAYSNKLKACLAGKVIMFERQLNYPDFAGVRWVETSLYPVRDHYQQIIGVALNEKDITAQRHIALKLRKSEIRLRGVLNNTVQAFFLLDKNHQLLLYNTAAVEYTRQAFGEQLKVGSDFVEFMPEDIKEVFNVRFAEALEGKWSSRERDIVFLDGSRHWFEVNYAPVESPEGDRDMVVFSMLDITERKMAEEREKKLLQEQIKYQLEQEALKRSAILEGQEKESHRISRELHDSVGQMLSALSYHLNDLDTMLKDNRNLDVPIEGVNKVDVTVERAKELLKEVIQEVREISHNLMPKILTDYGLIEALKQLRVDFASAVNIPINLDIFCESERFDDNIEISIFRITQEAVNNILKYAEASEVNIQLIEHETNLQLLVEDNGKGFKLVDVKTKSGNGLINMEERARLVGGTLSIDTEINKGTCIMVEIPLEHFGNEQAK
ncbi:PAS domain S-box protein [uncultured Microscilla sp.]|uniref:PAS domain-containing sensor histidine kinase n=1 Tax=uncultured Microscilla sp. TaxID=432653 RepID=UPI00261B7E4F|nr:PAS domain S-box protein [uncultured Microscilla sp.]